MSSMESQDSPVREVRWIGRYAVVDVEGDIDLSRSARFQQSLLEVMDGDPERIVVNLAAVNYMDSSGVASLVKLLSRSRKQGVALRLSGLCQRVRSIFEITRLDSVFEICSTEEEALA
ncbi:MAG: STAS domain-containing protein [Phycisphaerae bacterium]